MTDPRFEYMASMGIWGSRPNAHAKISSVTKPPLDDELDALKADHPDDYAVLSEHFELDELRSKPTETSGDE